MTITGAENIDKVIRIDQSPIGRTPRSNPATYTGVFSQVRDLFAMMPESRERGYKAGRFSFNVPGGRCEACQGEGQRRIEMNFLPDVYVQCEVCGGRRYNHETLHVKYKGYSIAYLLETPPGRLAERYVETFDLRRRTSLYLTYYLHGDTRKRGVALLRASTQVKSDGLTPDEKTGFQIIVRACSAPIHQIAENAGQDGGVVVSKVADGKGNFGYDALNDTYTDLVKAGIIDPTKVTRSALQNAASVSTLLLTSDALIADAPKPDEKPAGGGGHGGYDDMY